MLPSFCCVKQDKTKKSIQSPPHTHRRIPLCLCWQRWWWWWFAYAIRWRTFRQSSITRQWIDEVNPRISSFDTLYPSEIVYEDTPSSAYSCDFDFMYLMFTDCWIHSNVFGFVILLSTWRRMNGIRGPKLLLFPTPERTAFFPVLDQFEQVERNSRQWKESSAIKSNTLDSFFSEYFSHLIVLVMQFMERQSAHFVLHK